MTTFNIIVAIDLDRGIGKDGYMPWDIPDDMRHFKEITCKTSDLNKKNAVIMGRKTWESIPERFRPLSGRINIVLSKNKDLKMPDGVIVADSFKLIDVILSKMNDIENIFIIGGQQIFEQVLKQGNCTKLYITHIKDSFKCDTFFPKFSHLFKETYNSSDLVENGITYSFAEYIKK
jgi:dihydrofolate reductase/thymidylate synthase